MEEDSRGFYARLLSAIMTVMHSVVLRYELPLIPNFIQQTRQDRVLIDLR